MSISHEVKYEYLKLRGSITFFEKYCQQTYDDMLDVMMYIDDMGNEKSLSDYWGS